MEDEIKFKQFIIIPNKIPKEHWYSRGKMSIGKAVSQGAHASFMALENQIDKHLINDWKNSGQCVIVLKAKDGNHLMSIAKYFEQWEIVHHLYIDEGYTEVMMGTPTALATGVLTADQFWMISKLKLK